MKKHFALICSLVTLTTILKSQSYLYSVPVEVNNVYLRDSVHVVGQLDLEFPEDGTVFVQFDGTGVCTWGDRIVLAANNEPKWEANNGNVIFSSLNDEDWHCFSHTRQFPVTAGQHSYFAVAHNFVELSGSGFATIYGILYVEYFPQSSVSTFGSSTIINDFDFTQPLAYDSVSIETTEPGTVELRLNGGIECGYGDVLVVAATDSKNWDYTDPYSIQGESPNPWSTVFAMSNTRLFEVADAGTSTFYAMAQRGYELEGDGLTYTFTNLHARYYPDATGQVIENEFVSRDDLVLASDELILLDSIRLHVDHKGKVQIRFDGNLQSAFGSHIVIAASDYPGYEDFDGRVLLQTVDTDMDRHPVVHTRIYDVEPGDYTYYIMARNLPNTGPATMDISGNFMVKYFPDYTLTATEEVATLPFDIFPNPAGSSITIQCAQGQEALKTNIFDLHGRLVQHAEPLINGQTIEVSSLLPGVYFVSVENSHGIGVKRLIKQ